MRSARPTHAYNLRSIQLGALAVAYAQAVVTAARVVVAETCHYAKYVALFIA